MEKRRQLTKQALLEELLDPKTMAYLTRGDYYTGVAPTPGQVAVKKTTDQLIPGTSEPSDRFGYSALPRGGVIR